MTTLDPLSLFTGQKSLSHVGYVVPDLEVGMSEWVATLGAGPFFYEDPVVFDRVEYLGSPAKWEHACAFGQCGAFAVELQEIRAVDPPGAAEVLRSAALGLNHVSYFAPTTPQQESARLESLGFPRLLVASVRDVEITWHDVPALGCAIEIHKESTYMRTLLAAVAAAAQEWDGTDSVRPMPSHVES